MTETATSRTAAYGILGGFAGAIAMGAIAYMMPVPNTGGAPFFVAAAMMMGMGSAAWVGGWALHLFTGIVIGAVFGVAVARFQRFRLATPTRALGLGAIAGIATWVLLFMPMMAVLMPALLGMSFMVGGSFAAHLIFGVMLGGVAFAVARAARPAV